MVLFDETEGTWPGMLGEAALADELCSRLLLGLRGDGGEEDAGALRVGDRRHVQRLAMLPFFV